MLMHFATTGTKFPYSYYLGIKSASLFGEVKLWYLTKPNSEYFDKIVKEVPSEQVSIPDFPALKNRDEHFNLVSKFDYIIWKVVAKYGGSVMGLDSLTIKPFQNLLEDKDMLVGIDAETVNTSYCMHGATAKYNSKIAEKIHEDSTRALYGEEIDGKNKAFQDGKLRFGGAGIIPFLNNVYKNVDKVRIVPFGVLGGYMHDNSPFFLYEKEGKLLSPDTRTIPFYATWQSKKFAEITEQSIKGTLLGRLVEELNI